MGARSLPLTAPTIEIVPRRGWASLGLREVWEYGELLYFLVWRDLKVRYKQTLLGVLWIVLQPVVSMLVFSALFGILLRVPSEGVPYPIFAYAGLLPWNYFAASLTRSAGGLVANSHLVSKIYFPRLIIPISGVLSGLIDFGVAFLVLIGLMIYYGVAPTSRVVFLPAFLLLAMLTALGFGLWLSALNARYRDINHMIPIIVQLWMYGTPVIYSTSLIPERFHWLLALNPMATAVRGFRWALFGWQQQGITLVTARFGVSIAVMFVALVSGIWYFRHTEDTFADII